MIQCKRRFLANPMIKKSKPTVILDMDSNMDAVFVNIILSENQRLPVNYMYSCFAAIVGSYLLEIFSIKVAHRRSKM